MNRIAIMTDSNSGITQLEGEKLGITVVPMPFYIDGELYYEDVDINADRFFKFQEKGCNITTSQPITGDLLSSWRRLLETHDSVLYIPMSSGLPGACSTAAALSQDFGGRVQVVDNQRISLTMRSSVFDAMRLADKGLSAAEIKKILEADGLNATIYIMVDTLKYLKKGGRITPAAAAIGSILRIKPVLQIQGDKLDSFAIARSVSQAKSIMCEALKHDFTERFGCPEDGEGMQLDIAYTGSIKAAEAYMEELKAAFPACASSMVINPLSLSVSCHIGAGSLAVAASKKLDV
jgi:DegV family protein with EDD domain